MVIVNRCFGYAVFLVLGTMVGVGLLAVPVMLGLAGFVPGLLILLAVLLLAWCSGFALAERVMDGNDPNGDLATLYQRDLGGWTRLVTLPAYLLLFYALLVAYLTGAATIISHLTVSVIPLKGWIVLVFLGASVFVVFGRAVLLRWNGVIVLTMMAAFAVLLALSFRHAAVGNLRHANWSLAPLAAPALCCAFAYHNVIPVVCRELQGRRRAVHLALSAGLVLAAGMTALWFYVVAGTLPFEQGAGAPSLLAAFQQGVPATVPLAQVLRQPAITAIGLLFSMLAIVSSYLGVGTALSSFWCDIAPGFRTRDRRFRLFAVTYLPPLLMALLRPDLFLGMVDITGGLGMILLFGIMPTLAYLLRQQTALRSARLFMGVVATLFFALFLIELAKEADLVYIDPVRGACPGHLNEVEQHSMDWLYELEKKMLVEP